MTPIRNGPAWDVYLVTANTFARRPLFQTDRVAGFFLETMFHFRDEGKYRMHEFIMMPDHCHLLLAPAPQVGLERAVQLIQGVFAYRLRRELALNLEVWERDYLDYRVRDSVEYERQARHIWQEPVEAQLAIAAEYYPYSSAYPGYRMDPYPEQFNRALLLQA